jgi:hypothetical protein
VDGCVQLQGVLVLNVTGASDKEPSHVLHQYLRERVEREKGDDVCVCVARVLVLRGASNQWW